MRTDIPEKLLAISDDIAAQGNALLTRLTVLKRWFEPPQRLTAFAVWIAARASSRKGKTSGSAAELFRAARALLAGANRCQPQLDRVAAQKLYDRLRAFQNEYQNQQWGPVRVIQNWNLFLVESGLEIYLGHDATPSRGYKLAADYCQHYDSRYGNGLNGPSRTKIEEIVRYILKIGIETTDGHRCTQMPMGGAEYGFHPLGERVRRKNLGLSVSICGFRTPIRIQLRHLGLC